MHITYKYERNLTYVEINNSDSSRTPQSIMTIIDKRISDLRKEEKEIRQICIKLTQFLKKNSLTPFNDDIIEYLQHFINEEKQKQSTGTDNTDIIRGLERMIEDYTHELNLFKPDVSSRNDSISPNEFDNDAEIDEIFDLVQRLYVLPINGRLIEEQIRRIKEGRIQATRYDEQLVDLPPDFNSPELLNKLKEIVNRRRRQT